LVTSSARAAHCWWIVAPSARAFGDQRRRERGLALAVVDGVDAAEPRAPVRRDLRGGLLGAQHPRVDVELARGRAPALPLDELLRVAGRIEQAAAPEAEITANVRRHFVPQPERDAGERQLARIAVLLPAPAPVAARLLAADVALLEQRDRLSALREEIPGRRTDNAAADDDDVGRVGKLLVAADTLGRG